MTYVRLVPHWRTLFGLIVLTLALPFFTVSCQGQPLAQIQGYHLVVGGQPTLIEPATSPGAAGLGAGRVATRPPMTEVPRLAPHWLAILALVLALAGLCLGWWRPGAWLVPLSLAVSGVLALLGLKADLEVALGRSSRGMAQLEASSGYWLALLLFLAAGLRASWPRWRRWWPALASGTATDQPPPVRPVEVGASLRRSAEGR